MNKLVSIIVPAYNAQNHIGNTIKSVIAQTYENWELIIIDDGSTDDTYKIIDEYKKEDERIFCHRISNSGVSTARNTALDYAKGEFVIFLDSDDCYEKNYIYEMLQLIDKEGVELACCGYRIENFSGKVISNEIIIKNETDIDTHYKAIDNMLENKCFNILWNKIFVTKIIKENSIYMDSKLSMGEDLLFVLDYLKCMKGKIVTTDKVLYVYKINSNGLQSSFRENNYDRRVSQWNKLRALYTECNYPLKGIDEELMRITYTSIMESDKTNRKSVLKNIYSTKEYGYLISNGQVYGTKNKVFMILLKSKNAVLISIAVCFFSLIKSVSGRKIAWD